ncbi:prephenate dehydrogenase [Clostridium prolinivorans]|uniref:prephenate dehydrogenase n=1 Tax=Clostridium prolinivorans TaxID=2769420 RepID=UPI002B05DA7C|nr:prephenate dehydrogenase [Clostridium prolinivorans]
MVILEDLDFNITIVGLGLMGGSYAMALKELNPKNLWAVDINEDTLKTAEEMGIINKGYTKPEVPLKDSDIVIIALYPKSALRFVKDYINSFKSGAIITDIGGIKEEIVNEINSFLPDDLEFIGGHPMAGKEKQGLKYASKDIFTGASYIFTPVERNKEKNIQLLENIARKIGCKNTVRVNPKQHDEIIALTSHLPHVIAVSLINSSDILNLETSLFVGGSFKDGTRVAEINSSLWVELLISNKKNILNTLDIFENNIKMIKNAIMENNCDFIKSEFEKASLKRKELG